MNPTSFRDHEEKPDEDKEHGTLPTIEEEEEPIEEGPQEKLLKNLLSKTSFMVVI